RGTPSQAGRRRLPSPWTLGCRSERRRAAPCACRASLTATQSRGHSTGGSEMPRIIVLTAAGLATAALALTPALAARHAGGVKYSSTLGIRAEIPKPKGASLNAGGTFAMTLTHTGSGYSVAWRLTFYRLSGKALAAHIHIGPPSGTGPVAVPLCGPC